MAPPKDITITVSGATERDTLPLAQVEALAFEAVAAATNNNTLGMLMFGPTSSAAQTSRAQDLAEKLRSVPEMRLFKAVVAPYKDGTEGKGDGEGEGESKVVGIASWQFYTDPFPEQDTWQDQPYGHAANPELCNRFFGRLARKRTEYMGGKRFAWLDVLAVHPDYQNIGVGGKLLQAGLDEAAELGLDIAYLEATDRGHSLYKKFGWTDLEELVEDLSEYGGKGVEKSYLMRRG